MRYYPNLALSAFLTKNNNQVFLSKEEAQKRDRMSYFSQKDGSNAYPVYSLYDIYNKTTTMEAYFKGKVVFIGESGTLIHDSVRSQIADIEMP